MAPEIMDKQLQELDRQCRELGLKLARQAKTTLAGYPPDAWLIEEAEGCKKSFAEIKKKIRELCHKYGLETAAELTPLCTTAQLMHCWENIKERLKYMPEITQTPWAPVLSPEMPAPSPADPVLLQELIESLIKENKLVPAFWLSAYFELLTGEAPPIPPLWLKMIEASRLVRGNHQESVNELARFYGEAAEIYRERPFMQWLAFSAALLPALHAPSCGARQVLYGLDALPLELINFISTFLSTQEERDRLQGMARKAACWLEANRELGLASPLAERLWRSLLDQGGLIYRLLGPIAGKDRSKREEVEIIVNGLEDESCRRRELSREYRDMLLKYRIILKVQGEGEPGALTISGAGVILEKLEEALTLAKEWLHTFNTAGNGAEEETGENFAAKLEEAIAPARKRVDALVEQQEHSRDRSLFLAAILAGQTLERFAASLTKGERLPGPLPGRLAALSAFTLPGGAGMPGHKAVARVGQAIFNYFCADLYQRYALPLQNRHNNLARKGV